MEYTVKQLSSLAGVSTRTLRYYDEIGLLKPAYKSSSGYRMYGSEEVDTLQQILFFRELGLELQTVKNIMQSDSYNKIDSLKNHLQVLEEKKDSLLKLIKTVSKTILKEEGKIKMADIEKFEGFKKKALEENEQKYGAEIRDKYGSHVVEESNRKWMGISKKQYEEMEDLTKKIQEQLEEAVRAGEDPSGSTGQRIAKMHKEWLSKSLPDYSKEIHVGIAAMYVEDERFKAYYDGNQEGCAMFLRDAVRSMNADR
jgi:DNA-binding transcriptional MerR regulator